MDNKDLPPDNLVTQENKNAKISKKTFDVMSKLRHSPVGKSVYFIAFLVLIVFLTMVALFIRLKNGPISLNFIEKTIEDLASSPDLKIDIEKPFLTLNDNGDGILRIIAHSVEAKPTSGGRYFFENIRIGIRKKDLLLFRLRPGIISVEKTNLLKDLKNNVDEDNPTLSIGEIYKNVFEKGYLSSLKKMIIHNISVDLPNQIEDMKILSLKKGMLEILHQDDKLIIKAAGDLKTDYFTNPIEFAGLYNSQTGLFSAGLDVIGMQTGLKGDNKIAFKGSADVKIRTQSDDTKGLLNAHINAHAQNGKILFADKNYDTIDIEALDIKAGYFPLKKKFDVSVKKFVTNYGSLEGDMSSSGIEEKEIYASTFKGSIKKFNYDNMFEKAITLNNINIEGLFDKKSQNIILETLSLDAEKTKIHGTLALYNLNKDIGADANITLDNLTFDDLLALWPINLPGSARAWMRENVVNTNFGKGTLALSHKPDISDFPNITLDLPYKNGDFSYRKPMPNVTSAQGTIMIRDKALDISLESGKILDISIQKGNFKIPDINASIPQGIVTMSLAGGMQDIFTILDTEPLEIMTPNKVVYQHSGGNFTGNFELSLPLLATVDFKDVTMKGDVSVSGAAVNLVDEKYKLADINGKLNFTHQGLKSNITTIVNNIPVKGTWEENFVSKAPISTKLALRGTVNETSLKNLSIDLSDYWEGSADADMKMSLKSGEIKALDVTLNAKESRIFIPDSLIEDKKGDAKKIHLTGYQKGEDIILDNIVIDGTKLKTTFQDMRIAKDTLAEFKIKDMYFKGFTKGLSATYNATGKIPKVTGQAEIMDIRGFTDYDPPMSDKPLKAEPFTNINTDMVFKTLYVTETKKLKNVIFHAHRATSDPNSMNISAQIGKSKKIFANITKTSDRDKTFAIRADNAGAFLKAYDAFHYYRDGVLNISGTIVKEKQGTDAIMKGHVLLDDGYVINAPMVANIFSLASLTGIVDRLESNDLGMDKISADFTKQGDNLTVKNGVLHGSAIGLSFKGTYNFATSNANLSGTMIPVYGLNSFVSNIPLLGELLTSREGEGIFGMTYRIKGSFENPNISINPLSVVAPGILRRIFE